jgi:hypothetical protein
MREKLFIETNKNNCVICGFKSLFYLDLIQHLDIHFYCNYLKKEGKNLFRKKANNKNNWIYGDGGKNTKNKNLEIDTEERKKNGITLINLKMMKNLCILSMMKIEKYVIIVEMNLKKFFLLNIIIGFIIKLLLLMIKKKNFWLIKIVLKN